MSKNRNFCKRCKNDPRYLGELCPCRERQDVQQLRQDGRFWQVPAYPQANAYRSAKGGSQLRVTGSLSHIQNNQPQNDQHDAQLC